MAARYIFPDSRAIFQDGRRHFFFFFKNQKLIHFSSVFQVFSLKNQKKIKKKFQKKKSKIKNFKIFLKKNREAAPKKEAGGDAKHVYFFTWPNI